MATSKKSTGSSKKSSGASSSKATIDKIAKAAMDAFAKNQEAMRGALQGGLPGANVFADLAKRNMAMFEEAGRAFAPGARKTAETNEASDVEKLKAELAALQAKVDKLGS